MEKGKDLERELLSLDGRGYPGYKSLKGEYDFGSFILCIDHVQSDPYAPPSKLRVKAKLSTTGITAEMVKTRAERIAIFDENLVSSFSARERHLYGCLWARSYRKK